MSRRLPILATLLACSLVALAAPAVAAGGPSDPIVVDDASPGFDLTVTDGMRAGSAVAVVWVIRDGTDEGVDAGQSVDGGATWESGDVEPGKQAPRASGCGEGRAAVTYSVMSEGPRAVLFRFIRGVVRIEHTLSETGVAHTRPDVACSADKRFFGVALRTADGTTRLKLVSQLWEAEELDIELDLGPANKGSTPAVAAIGDRLYVAWTQGTKLRFKRFTIASGPDRAMTSSPTVTLEDTASQSSPRLAADGKRVVLAWERKGSVVARVSTDKGRTFKARKVLFQGNPSSAKVAFVTDADVLGSTLIVSGAVTSEGISVKSSVQRTTNGGGTWSKVAGSERTGGFVVGVLGGTAGAPRLHVIWDERISAPDPQRLRARFIDLD